MKARNRVTASNRWNLFGCAVSGHETYEPTGSTKARAIARELCLETPQGTSWRCLRCGSYVLGETRYKSTLAEAPLVLRGNVLKQTLVLRFLAVERGIRGVILVALGVLVLHFKSEQGSWQRLLNSDLPALRDVAHSVGYNLDNSKTLHSITHTLSLSSHQLNVIALLIFVYAALLLTEATGLWLIKRWGEYFSAVVTAIFIPFEIYELTHHTTALKIMALAINIAAVLYLLITKRLFGIRGGGKAYEAALGNDNILEITKAAVASSKNEAAATSKE